MGLSAPISINNGITIGTNTVTLGSFIKLRWERSLSSDYEYFSKTPFGWYHILITKVGIILTFNEFVVNRDAVSLEIAKQFAQDDFNQRISECFVNH